MAGGTVAAALLLPFIFIFSIFGGFFEQLFGKNTAEVVLPYEPEKGIVWEYDDFSNQYFYLKETKIEDDTQVFVFATYTTYETLFGDDIEYDVQEYNAHYIWGGYWELIFTDKNDNSLFYYANPNNSPYGITEDKMVIYAPDEYVKWEYTPVPDDPRFEYSINSAEDYEYKVNEIDGQPVITFIKIPSFNEGEEFDVIFYFGHDYYEHSTDIITPYHYSESYTVTFKMKDGQMVVENKTPSVYRYRTIINGKNSDLIPVSQSEIK